MRLSEMEKRVKDELTHIPKGPRGSAQQILRAVYPMQRKHDFKVESATSRHDSLTRAVLAMASHILQWSDAVAASFRPVLNIGGGVFYFHNFLKKRIPHLTRPDDPIHANGIGYCNLAGNLLIRKIQSTSVNGIKAIS